MLKQEVEGIIPVIAAEAADLITPETLTLEVMERIILAITITPVVAMGMATQALIQVNDFCFYIKLFAV